MSGVPTAISLGSSLSRLLRSGTSPQGESSLWKTQLATFQSCRWSVRSTGAGFEIKWPGPFDSVSSLEVQGRVIQYSADLTGYEITIDIQSRLRQPSE